MEFFKQVDLDWMGKAKFFFALSFTLLLLGMISLVMKGGFPTASTLRVVRLFTFDLPAHLR